MEKSIQKLPWTARSEYAFPKIEDLPAQWLSSTARTLLGLKLPTTIVMRAVVDTEVATEQDITILAEIANKSNLLTKTISIVQFCLRLSPKFRNLKPVVQRTTALKKFIRGDYKTVCK